MCSTLFNTKNDHIDPTCHVCFLCEALEVKAAGPGFSPLQEVCGQRHPAAELWILCTPESP